MSLVGTILTLCAGSVDWRRAESADLKHVKEYANSPMGHYSSWFSGVFYAGTDDDFDYVAIKHGSNTIKVFKLKRGDLGVKRRMRITADEDKWADITRMFPLTPIEGQEHEQARERDEDRR